MNSASQHEVWLNLGSDPTLLLNNSGEVIFVNQAALNDFGMISDWKLLGSEEWKELFKNPSEQSFYTELSESPEKTTSVHVRCGRVETSWYLIIKKIDDSKELKKALEFNTHIYNGLAFGTIEGLALLQDEKIMDANAKMMQILGLSASDDFQGINVAEQLGSRNWKRLIARKEVFDFDFINTQGRKIIVEAKVTELPKTENFPSLLTLAMLDITEKRKISNTLLQTKERFRLLVETTPFGLLLVVKGKVQYVNQSALNLWGVQDEDGVFDVELVNLFSPFDRERIEEDLELVLKGEKTVYTEVSLVDEQQNEKAVGMQMVLSFYDGSPAVQITINDLSTQIELVQEKIRANIAEESNFLLKEEIKQHKRTQRQLKEAERFTRSIIESSIDMIMAFDVEGKVIQFNHAASVEFGISFEEAQGLHAAKFLADPNDFEIISQGLQTNGYFAGELTGIRSTKEEFKMLISVAVLREPDEEIGGFVSVGRDVTDTYLAEWELRKGEERYRDILDNAIDLVFLLDGQGNINYANPAFSSTLGYEPDELNTLNIQDLLVWPSSVSDDKLFWVEEISGSKREITVKGKSGKEVRLLGGSSSQEDDNGNAIGFRSIFMDISEMRAYQKEAVIQSAKLESIFNSTKYLLMFTIDKELKITTLNNNLVVTLKDQFGFDLNIGSSIIELLKAVTAKELYKGQMRLFERAAQGTPQQFELPLKNKSGTVVWYQLFVNPVEHIDGKEELSCIAYDISERKEIDNQIRSALREKEILLQEVHHRVKNNLQVISSILSLQRRFVSDPKMIEVLEESQNRISTMSFIHESLYQNTDFSSIGFSEYLTRLTHNLIQSYSKVASGVELVMDLDEVHINLKQAIPCGLIVNELISNALKHAFQGKEGGKIYISVKKKQDKIFIGVADNGVGLPSNFNFDTNESLGVYLVQALVEQLDGELIVDNKHTDNALPKDVGASFLFSFTPLTD